MKLELAGAPHLAVRPWQESDREAFAAMVADAEMMRYITGGRTWRDDEVDEFLERQRRNLRNHQVCMGALVSEGVVIGVAGIQPLDRLGQFELGWWVAKAYQGRGWATKIGRALIAHAFDVMALDSIYAVIHPDNTASIRVAEKLGLAALEMVPASTTNARRTDDLVVVYRLERGS